MICEPRKILKTLGLMQPCIGFYGPIHGQLKNSPGAQKLEKLFRKLREKRILVPVDRKKDMEHRDER